MTHPSRAYVKASRLAVQADSGAQAILLCPETRLCPQKSYKMEVLEIHADVPHSERCGFSFWPALVSVSLREMARMVCAS